MLRTQKHHLQETLVLYSSLRKDLKHQHLRETPAVENITFPIIATTKFQYIINEEKERKEKK